MKPYLDAIRSRLSAPETFGNLPGIWYPIIGSEDSESILGLLSRTLGLRIITADPGWL